MRGEPVHGESITDGDASGGVAVKLYGAGTVTERVLGTKETLHVTDVQVLSETGGDVSLVADSKAAGRYVVHGTVDAKGGIVLHFMEPYVCPVGKGLKLFGIATNIDSCLIQGFITKA